MRHRLNIFILLITAVFISCSGVPVNKEPEVTTSTTSGKDTCDDPDANINCSFVGMPDNISETVVIADKTEPGNRLIISGKVLMNDGKTPYKDVIMYFYHTDNNGVYAKTGNETGVRNWQGKLHGWCKTNANGEYKIETIRPASYPGTTAPAHIHCVIKAPGGKEPFYIKDFVFDDDPFVDEQVRNMHNNSEGNNGIVKLEMVNGTWTGGRNIVIPE